MQTDFTTADLLDPVANAKAIALAEGSTDALGSFQKWDKLTNQGREWWRRHSDSLIRAVPVQPYQAPEKKKRVKPTIAEIAEGVEA